jgi:molybdate transport system permease protein
MVLEKFSKINNWNLTTGKVLTLSGVAIAIIYIFFITLPILALVTKALGGADFIQNITGPTALQALRLSLLTSAISMLIIISLGSPFALLLSKTNSQFLKTVDLIVELPIILPPIVAGIAMLMAFGRTGLLGAPLNSLGITLPFTTTAVIMAQIFVSAPFYIRAAKIGFVSVPKELEEISETLGVSPWATFWRVTIPLAWPAMAGGAALAWARAMSEFGATIMFAGNMFGKTQTLPLAILSSLESNLETALAISLLLVGVSILILILLGTLGNAAKRMNH